MQRYWTNFAAQGSPSSAGQPAWPAFGSNSQQMISLVPPRPAVETGFAVAHHCAFWAAAS
jgi:carboxylesterase type B